MIKDEYFDPEQYKDDVKELEKRGIYVEELFHNAPSACLYEQALKHERGSFVSSTGALMVSSGVKTGRSPKDKRFVRESSNEKDVWWGTVNIPLEEKPFLTNRQRAVDFLNLQKRLFIVDAFAGWDPEYRIRVRVITSRAYHALFMQNMLVLPKREEIANFNPQFLIYNAGVFPANRLTEGMTSATSVSFHLTRGEMVVLGTQYAGEMKKGIFTLMNYMMVKKYNHLPLHSSCNVGPKGDVTLFFGLSGTGKTTLSADPHRNLIGDDEHVWTDKGVFNIEGGCYAKCIDLSKEKEPEIFDAIKFGAVLENVVFSDKTREVDYTDTSVTENTRAAYPLHHIPNALIPASIRTHPSNIILLTCDAFGVLPPVSKLNTKQVMYHFISGYTAKVAGTEMGITEPQSTFSACFGEPFLAWHPIVYAELLAKKLKEHKADAWLINTGWVGGAYGEGKRCPLKYTRAMVDAIHDGTLAKEEFEPMPVFGLNIPKKLGDVPEELLFPHKGWKDSAKYKEKAAHLANLFIENFKIYEDRAAEVKEGGPKL
eukprot:GHVL01003418.1.p1 GENE.GHVL01003418.1~~GHVL01003418.1.p1  ORF type:complete len:557 (+),score=76.21 GHVL01003418.1:51-1673(+)